MIQNPDFVMLDEPESGVDLENIALIGTTIGALLEKDKYLAKRKKSGLSLLTRDLSLDYIDAGQRACDVRRADPVPWNPREILKDIKQRGYKECLEMSQPVNLPKLSKTTRIVSHNQESI